MGADMKVKTDGCKPGDFIAVPLRRGGWAIALVVRQAKLYSRRPPHQIVTYGFGTLFRELPTLVDALKLRITDAVCLDFSSDYQVWNGVWPCLGQLAGFSVHDWPLPPTAGTAGSGSHSPKGEELVVHVAADDRSGSEAVWDSAERFILHDEYCHLPHMKGLGDAVGLSSALDLAIHEHHPWHYCPVTEARLAVWKRVMDRIIRHKPELAKIVGKWYTGVEAVETEELPSRTSTAKTKAKATRKGAAARTAAAAAKGSRGKARMTKPSKKVTKKVRPRRGRASS